MTIKDLNELSYLISEIKAMQCEIESMYNSYRSPAFEKIGSSSQRSGDPTADAVLIDWLGEYGRCGREESLVDKEIEITHWMPLPEPPEVESNE